MEDMSVDEHEDGSSGKEEEGVLRSRDSEDDQPGGSGHIYYAISDERKSRRTPTHTPAFTYVIISIIGLLLFGKLLEPLWGKKELSKFVFIVNFSTSMCVFVTAIAVYYVTQQESYLYTPLSGFYGALSGLLVGIKQFMPEMELNLFVLKIKGKLLHEGLGILPPSYTVWHLYELDIPVLLPKEARDMPERGSKRGVLFLKFLPYNFEGKTVEVGRVHFATENTRFTILDALVLFFHVLRRCSHVLVSFSCMALLCFSGLSVIL